MSRVLIIAEAGVNHNGCVETAKKLIDAAADAGADYVKFQTFKSENLVTKQAKQAEYQVKQAKDESQLAMLKKLELKQDDHFLLIDYCAERGIKFLTTPFDFESLEFVKSLNLGLWKIPSGEITNYPYLQKIGILNDKVILSTGMANLDEIKASVKLLIDSGTDLKNIRVLHCNTEYPTPFEDVNMKAMGTIKQEIGVDIGYSDHTLGIEIPIMAVALGATVIEKHFTIDKSQPGPDHAASLEPDELKKMVSAIRNIENSFGSGIKQPSPSEKKNTINIRKSIVANTSIKKGELFSAEILTTKRPATGRSPMEWDQLIGTTAEKDYEADENI
jgi:N,N'-diacetyllegionaminate synthase